MVNFLLEKMKRQEGRYKERNLGLRVVRDLILYVGFIEKATYIPILTPFYINIP